MGRGGWTLLAGLCAVSAAHAAQQEHPRLALANVRKVMSVLYPRPTAHNVRGLQPALEQQAAVLSPDGTRMVFVAQGYRPEKARDKTPGGTVLVVRSLTTERNRFAMPVAMAGRTRAPGPLSDWLANNPFSRDGKHMLVPLFLDTDGDGLYCEGVDYDRGSDPVRLGLLSLKTARLAKTLGFGGLWLFASFDGSGERLLVHRCRRSSSRKGAALLTVASRRTKHTWPLARHARLLGVCPTATLVGVEFPGGPAADYTKPPLYLYDYGANKLVTPLPTGAPNLSFRLLPPVWTRNGRYYCYYLIRSGAREPNRTCIWDRTAGKLVSDKDIGVPGGTGPTPATIVAAKLGTASGMRLHDIATAQTGELGPERSQLLSARGGKVLYVEITSVVRRATLGVVCIGQIVMPRRRPGNPPRP